MTADKAQAFRALHVKGDPVVLFNIWDAGSARTVAAAGVRALATGSWSVAAAQGYGDGEQVPLELVLANLRRITSVTDLPVSLDFETGYGGSAAEVGRSIVLAVEAGAVGFNIEDGLLGGGGVRDPAAQAERLAAARRAADDAGVPAYLNARIDLFLQAPAELHGELLSAALERARTYAEAGADGVFAPGLTDEGLIGELCRAAPRPVNVMASPGAPSRASLAALGAARISHGPGPYRLAARALEDAARAALQ